MVRKQLENMAGGWFMMVHGLGWIHRFGEFIIIYAQVPAILDDPGLSEVFGDPQGSPPAQPAAQPAWPWDSSDQQIWGKNHSSGMYIITDISRFHIHVMIFPFIFPTYETNTTVGSWRPRGPRPCHHLPSQPLPLFQLLLSSRFYAKPGTLIWAVARHENPEVMDLDEMVPSLYHSWVWFIYVCVYIIYNTYNNKNYNHDDNNDNNENR